MDEQVEKPNLEAMLDAAATPVETATEEVAEVETPEVETVEEVPTDEVAEETPAEEVVEEVPTDETVEEAPVEIPTFAETTAEFTEQAKGIAEKYELPADLKATIDAMTERLATTGADFTDYGTVDDVKQQLDRINLLQSDRLVGSNPRPNTDQFVETLEPTRKAWLFHDLASQPSQIYDGLTVAQERIIMEFGEEGQSVPEVLSRYDTFTKAMKTGIFESSVPQSIPLDLHEAYYKLPADIRDEIAVLSSSINDTDQDPEQKTIDQTYLQSRLDMLKHIQAGIAGEKLMAQQTQSTIAQQEAAFASTVDQKETNFFITFRDQFTSELAKDVENAPERTALLIEAMDTGATGEWARKQLESKGIKFDAAKAQALINKTRSLLVTATSHENAKGKDGKVLDQVALNKAQTDLKKLTTEWNDFGTNIRNQMVLTTKGQKTPEAKPVVKARVLPKGNSVMAKKPAFELPPVGDATRLEKLAEGYLQQNGSRGSW